MPFCNHCYIHREVMSINAGMCLQCFDSSYVICAKCGDVTQKPGLNRTYGRAVYSRGDWVCWECHHSDVHSYWKPKPFDVSFATYGKIRSERKYGVEIETSCCRGSDDLRGKTHFGRKSDPTVGGFEFDSPVLYGDEGLEYIGKFLEFAESKSWVAGSDCGCHTHYDMRDENYEQLVSTAYAYRLTSLVWQDCVPAERASSSYCRIPRWSEHDFRRVAASHHDFNSLLYNLHADRYEVMNLTAWNIHTTFEVRVLEGTVDAETICNWITAHCRFIDGVRNVGLDRLLEMFGGGRLNSVRYIAKILDDDSLMNWLREKARKYGKLI